MCEFWASETFLGQTHQPEHSLKVRYDFSEAHCIRDHIIRRDLSKVKTFFLTHPTYQSGLCPFLEISFSPKRGPETPLKWDGGLSPNLLCWFFWYPTWLYSDIIFTFTLLSTFTFRRKWKWNHLSEWSWYGCPENHHEGCDLIAIQDWVYLPPSYESQKIQNLENCSSERGRNGSTRFLVLWKNTRATIML